MDLHELLSTAVADLPDAPDLVPEAQRIHRRRTAVTRAGVVAASAALVVGAGTLTIASPWSRHTGSNVTAVSQSSRSDSASTLPVSDVPIVDISPGERKPAPMLSGETVSGTSTSTSYLGHVTVLSVWGSWSTPCRAMAPTLATAYTAGRSTGVQFFGIDVRDDESSARAFQEQFGIDYPSFRDSDENLAHKLSEFIPAEVVPRMVIIDANGDVAVTIAGALTPDQLSRQIAYAEAT